MKKYDLIVCGGTFDLLHKGHKKFLQDILGLSERVLLGITSNVYVSNFKHVEIEDFKIRKKAVEDFLESIGAIGRVKIVLINQAYEPLLTSEFSPKAIAVTSQTKKTALEINQKRKELGLPPLKIIVIEMAKADDGGLISSTRIRNGEINRDGQPYVRSDWKNKTLRLPRNLRPYLHKPFGKIMDSPPSGLDSGKTITIGDVSTQKFNQAKVGQFLSVVDFKVHRQKMFDELSELGFDNELETITVENPAGTITWELFGAIRKAFSSINRKIILVNGEEDLSFLPAMLIAPLGFSVYYGQPPYAKASEGKPDEGLVEVQVTEENKEKIYDLVSKFTQQT